jgi:hypothetical protein
MVHSIQCQWRLGPVHNVRLDVHRLSFDEIRDSIQQKQHSARQGILFSCRSCYVWAGNTGRPVNRHGKLEAIKYLFGSLYWNGPVG